VELLFFEQGQEPDVGILGEAPEVSELNLPGAYEKAELEGSAKPGAFLLTDFSYPMERDLDDDPFRATNLELVGKKFRQAVVGSETTNESEATATIFYDFAQVPTGEYQLVAALGRLRYLLEPLISVRKKGVMIGDERIEDIKLEAQEEIPLLEPVAAMPTDQDAFCC